MTVDDAKRAIVHGYVKLKSGERVYLSDHLLEDVWLALEDLYAEWAQEDEAWTALDADL